MVSTSFSSTIQVKQFLQNNLLFYFIIFNTFIFYFSEEIGLPCHQFQIGIVNFDVNKYHIVKTMIEYTGGLVVDEVTPSTKFVVSLT